MKLIFLLAGCFSMFLSQAQNATLSGSVTDSKDAALPFVNILLLEAKDSSLIKGTTTDENGSFQLEDLNAGNFLVLISSIGYTKSYFGPLELAEGETKSLGKIVLKESSESLEEITVVAQKPFIERRFDMTIVNVENSIVSAGNTALEVLRRSPGVMIDKDGNISLKGKSGLTIMIDGKPTYLSSQDVSTMLSNLPADQVERIEIITNPSARYDASGQGGVINIVLKKNKMLGSNGSVYVSYTQGFYDRENAGFNLNHRTEKWNFFGSYNYGRRNSANWFDLSRKFRENEQVESIFKQTSQGKDTSQSHSGKFGVDFYPHKNHTIGFFVNAMQTTGGDRNTNNTFITDAIGGPLSSSQTNGKNSEKWSNFNSNINYRWVTDTTGGELKVNLDYAIFDQSNPQFFVTDYFDAGGTPFGIPLILRSELPGKVDIKSAKADYVKSINKKLRLETGIKSSFVSTDNNARYWIVENGTEYVDTTKTNHFKYTENINAAYLNGQYQLSDKIGLQFGLRVENTRARGEQITIDSVFTRNYTQLFPSGAMSYTINKKNEINFSYSRRIDRPSYRDLNPFLYFLDPYTYMRGNTLLQPQFTNAFEVGHTFMGFLTTTVGYSHTTGVITQVTSQVDSTRTTFATNENLNSLENWTISSMLPIPISKWWMSMNFITAYHNQYNGKISGQSFDVGMWSWMINSTNQFTFSKGWSAELSAFYMSKQVYGVFIMKPMSSISLGVQKKIMKEKGTIKFSAGDLFWKSRFRGTVFFNNMDINMEAWSDSRVFTLSFSYKFGNAKIQNQRKESGAKDELDRIKQGT